MKFLVHYLKQKITVEVLVSREDSGYSLEVTSPLNHKCGKTYHTLKEVGRHLQLCPTGMEIIHLVEAFHQSNPYHQDMVDRVAIRVDGIIGSCSCNNSR